MPISASAAKTALNRLVSGAALRRAASLPRHRMAMRPTRAVASDLENGSAFISVFLPVQDRVRHLYEILSAEIAAGATGLMPVHMMHVGRVRMGVSQRVMLMPVGVRFALRVVRPMFVLVMFV